jgi:lipopolysaccharide/colanic/teichoic acid biosynthesis glycosyltransferase
MSLTTPIKNWQPFDYPLELSFALRHPKTDFANAAHPTCCIDQHCILGQLRHEIKRAQRSGSALSVLVVNQNQASGKGAVAIRRLLKTIRLITRETDAVGYIDQRNLAVLLPYTDEDGANKVREKLMASYRDPQFSFVTSTYPNQLFDSLTKNGCVSPDALNLMFEESTQNSRVKPLIKRGLDITGSILGLLILSPVMLITAALVKYGSPGPVIFKQTRLGYKGVPFTFYKFRSMRVGASDQIHRDFVLKLINGDHVTINNGNKDNPLYKIKFDPRICRVGRFIRKTSIDELPQLYNVLKGDMSLVAPRPPLAYEAEKYQPWQLRRILYMKPGITGFWQVEGRI